MNRPYISLAYIITTIALIPDLGKMQESFIQPQAKAGTKERWLSDSGDRNPEEEGIDISLLEHISPIEWDDVLLYGEYVIDPSLIR